MNVSAPKSRLFMPSRRRALRGAVSCVITAVGVLCVTFTIGIRTPSAQDTSAQDTIPCQSPPEFANFVNPPEINDRTGGILKGTIYLVTERQRLPTSIGGAQPTCRTQSVRNFRKDPPSEKRADIENTLHDPMPGPTLRARVGDLVQLAFVNQIYPAFEASYDVDDCTPSTAGYPGNFGDTYPNCLHASSTANIHFHGTHTNPDSTGDNVYLQVRPLPRNNQRVLDPELAAEATATFKDFFNDCTNQLKDAPLKYWPATWNDMPPQWVAFQERELKRYQENFEKTNKDKKPQRLFDMNQAVRKAGGWPLYYIGAFPYCFALPEYRGAGAAPVMGQIPGTHWYHAHKHGSTHINVMNGMTGAFIIEGKYDDDLNAAYGGFRLGDEKNRRPWHTRSQNVLVLNQLGTEPTAVTGRSQGIGSQGGGVDFTVNGRLRPIIDMQPGEIQLWRIINASARTAAYFMPPAGLEWRQIAQDGVAYSDAAYKTSANHAFYMAPANRVDLLVRAPIKPAASTEPVTVPVHVQNLMSRLNIDSEPSRILLKVRISGAPPVKDGIAAEMPFLAAMPDPPDFLRDISEEEFEKAGSIRRTLEFNSLKPSASPPGAAARQHTINRLQFGEHQAHISVVLGAVEEWKIVNSIEFTAIDHPLHIHINPFQVNEYFDPNEMLVDATGQPIVDETTGVPIDRYVFRATRDRVGGDKDPPHQDQCLVFLDDPASWKPCHVTKQGHWWDVFAMPTGRTVTLDGRSQLIPGHFKMRSRFVDYPGMYVMHCHILIHEDRGMMYSVEVIRPSSSRSHH